MEHQKMLNLLSEANHSKIVTRKWNICNDQLYGKYGDKFRNLIFVITAMLTF